LRFLWIVFTMTPQLQEQLNTLATKVEPFTPRANAVADAIMTLNDTIVMIATSMAIVATIGTEAEVAPPAEAVVEGAPAAAAEIPVAEAEATTDSESTTDTQTKKSRRS
jgi:hypothetical protein